MDLIHDQRRGIIILYSLRDVYLSSFAMFFLQDPSVLEFQRRFQDQTQSNNLSSVFAVEQIPSDTRLREIVDSHDYQALGGVFGDYLYRLQRSKQLQKYQFLPG